MLGASRPVVVSLVLALLALAMPTVACPNKNSRVTVERGLIGDKSLNSVPASLPTVVNNTSYLCGALFAFVAPAVFWSPVWPYPDSSLWLSRSHMAACFARSGAAQVTIPRERYCQLF